MGEVDIKRGIFQGDSLSPLLFVLAMVPLTMLLKRETIGYRFGSGQQMIHHLLFMDDLKLYGRSEEELEKLVDVVDMFSRDIGMEFGLDKCDVLILKQGSKVHCEGISLPDGQELCTKYGVKCADAWYKEVPDQVRVSEDGQVEIWWDRVS